MIKTLNKIKKASSINKKIYSSSVEAFNCIKDLSSLKIINGNNELEQIDKIENKTTIINNMPHIYPNNNIGVV